MQDRVLHRQEVGRRRFPNPAKLIHTDPPPRIRILFTCPGCLQATFFAVEILFPGITVAMPHYLNHESKRDPSGRRLATGKVSTISFL
jgi:hypothetical protein